MGHCDDNAKDRRVGAYWERQFCKMAAVRGRSFSPLQLNHSGAAAAYQRTGAKWNKYTLPDVTVWTYPGEHHEIKHKDPTKWGTFGLEVYRYEALKWFATETRQDVMYTIHNHALAGGRDVRQNNIAHWQTVNVLELDGRWTCRRPGYSWVSGEKELVDIYYWSTTLWTPLAEYWQPPPSIVVPKLAVAEAIA